MSILSDKSIIDRCIMPSLRFDEAIFKGMSAYAYQQYGHTLALYSGSPDEIDPPNEDSLREMAMVPWTFEQKERWKPMIAPFTPKQIKKLGDAGVNGLGLHQRDTGILSRGLTSYGYDVALAPEFKVFSNINSAAIDPKRLDPRCLVTVEPQIDEDTGEQFVMMPPNSYLLGRTLEWFVIPRDVMVICVGKSTYARSGGIVNVTPIEPGFEGNVVIEISNSTNLPARVYANEGIAQFMFLKGDRPCATSYGDRGGKYQGQSGITLPKV